jgi:O-acetylhomoserine (thiol)-lyase
MNEARFFRGRCMKRNYSPQTICVHGSYNPQNHNRARAVPLYQSSAFVYDTVDHAANLFSFDEPGFIYSRLGNPTVDEAEKRIALLEGGQGAVAFASGMAALTGFCLNMLKPGDEILAADCLYGGSMGLLRDTLQSLQIHTRFFDPIDNESLEHEITPKTRLVLVENLANPTLVVPDVAGISAVLKKHRLPLLVDNTIATPLLTNPITHGANFVIHSCTKYMEGHGNIIGGMIIDAGTFSFDQERYPSLFEEAPGGFSFFEKFGKDAFLTRLRGKVLMNTGGCMAPFHAYMLIHGLESLHVRMERHCENAATLASFLSKHKKVAWVNYPGFTDHPSHKNAVRYFKEYFGAMVGFGLKGGYEKCKSFINKVQLLSHSTNIGDTKTLVIHPASTTHRNMTCDERLQSGVSDDFIRMSVGIENSDDLIQELENALISC